MILRTGAPWQLIRLLAIRPIKPGHRRFQQWQRSRLLTRLLQKLAEDLRDRGKLDLSESFIDASFSSAKKGALVSALQNAAKGESKIMGNRRPPWSSWAPVYVVSASPNEATLVESTLQRRFLRETPERLIGDKAYDSDPLDQRHTRTVPCGIDLAAPLEPQQALLTQDGRVLAAPLPSSLENRASV